MPGKNTGIKSEIKLFVSRKLTNSDVSAMFEIFLAARSGKAEHALYGSTEFWENEPMKPCEAKGLATRLLSVPSTEVKNGWCCRSFC